MQRTKQSHIYLFRIGSHYKIGRSNNPKQRARLLFNSLPGLEVEIIHTFTCEHVKVGEQLLHNHFADKRTQGEWFALESGDLQWFTEEAEGYIIQKTAHLIAITQEERDAQTKALSALVIDMLTNPHSPNVRQLQRKSQYEK